jgi:uncharacterized protein (UPF0303 family)
MNNIDELLLTLEKQENELQFSEFTSETALKIGLKLIEKAKKNNQKISIDITRNNHILFHYSFEGTSPDNDQWIIRKNRTVNRFNKSSFHVGVMLKSIDKTLEEKFYISTVDYAAHGGAFPIIIKGVGVVGTITVSGLAQEEDHEMVVTEIKEYLSK